MPRPAPGPYLLGEPVRAELNSRDTEILDYVDEVSGGTGVGGRTATFSQPAGVPAKTGGSPKFVVPFDASVVQIALATVSAPAGAPLTTQFLKNGVVFSTLQIADGTTITQTQTTGLPVVLAGDELTVNATEVGIGVAAQGVTAQMELG
jgi:hypothetical protein